VVDVFEEVEGQLRAERYRSLLTRGLPWIIGGAVLVLALAIGLWGWDAWKTSSRNKSSETYAQAMEAVAQRDEAKAFTLFGDVAKTGPAGYRALALMQQGGMRLEAGDTAGAVKLLDDAAKAAPDPVLGDFARLKSAFALMDTAPYKDVEGRLNPLTDDKRPYRMEAKEALAFLKLRDAKFKEARGDFVVLSQIFDATPGMRQRAKAAISLIDSGGAGVMAQAAKAAATAPPPPAMPQGFQPGAPIEIPPGAEAPQ
jgi:hypothetical protein